MRCNPRYFKGPRRRYTPSTPSGLHYWLKPAKEYADACAEKYPALLDTSRPSTRSEDMDRSARALGVDKISFYGYSYGTYLGEVYSTLHPDAPEAHGARQQRRPASGLVPGATSTRTRHSSATSRSTSAGSRGITTLPARRRPRSRRAALLRRPGALTQHAGQGKLGPDEWADAIESAAYDRFGWEDVARAWHALAAKGQGRSDAAGVPRQATCRATTTSSPSTTRCSAPTRSGRRVEPLAQGRQCLRREVPVPHLEQRLVQRAVPVLGGARRTSR